MDCGQDGAHENVDVKIKLRSFLVQNLIDSFTVLFEEFSTKDSSVDIKEKSKTLLKLLYSNFSS
jgi:hypothetical protein